MAPFVKATAAKNDLVLDMFAGSGTTGVVAPDLGERFVDYKVNNDTNYQPHHQDSEYPFVQSSSFFETSLLQVTNRAPATPAQVLQ